MWKSILEYVVSSAVQWGRHVAGPAMAVVSLSSLAFIYFFDPDAIVTKQISKYSLIVAVLMLPVAQFSVWKRERDARRIAEDLLNAKANLCGTVMIQLQENPRGLGFRFDCANRGRKECQVNRLIMQVRLESGSVLQRNFLVHEPGAKVIPPDHRYSESGSFMFSKKRQPAQNCGALRYRCMSSTA